MSAFLAVPVSTVKKRLHEARKRLRRQLESVAEVEWRPSRDTRLQTRLASLTSFLDLVARGSVPAIAATLDAHSEYVNAPGSLPLFGVVSANALSIAALTGRADVVALLLDRGADPASPGMPASPLALAAIEGRGRVVDLLLKRGIEPDAFAAAALGDTARLRQFVERDPACVSQATPDGRTLLHFARSADAAALLLDAGADIDAVDALGLTPVQWVGATGRYKDVVALLRLRGARVPSGDLFWACAFGDLAAAEALLDADRSLLDARSRGEEGAARFWKGGTALYVAASRGELAIVRALIDRGGNVSLSAADGSTPLHVAAANGHFDTVTLLLASGADPGARDARFNLPAAAWAEFFGHTALARRLTG